MYRRHTGWIGDLKEVKYATLMAETPRVRHGAGC